MLAAYHAASKRQVRQAMVEIVRAGYQLGPPPPYGNRGWLTQTVDPSGRSKVRTVPVPVLLADLAKLLIADQLIGHGQKVSAV